MTISTHEATLLQAAPEMVRTLELIAAQARIALRGGPDDDEWATFENALTIIRRWAEDALKPVSGVRIPIPDPVKINGMEQRTAE